MWNYEDIIAVTSSNVSNQTKCRIASRRLGWHSGKPALIRKTKKIYKLILAITLRKNKRVAEGRKGHKKAPGRLFEAANNHQRVAVLWSAAAAVALTQDSFSC